MEYTLTGDGFLKHGDIQYKIPLPIQGLEKLDQLVYQLTLSNEKKLQEDLLRGSQQQLMAKAKMSWKSLVQNTKNFLKQQSVWIDEACSHGKRGHPSVVFVEFPANTSFLVVNNSAGNGTAGMQEAPPYQENEPFFFDIDRDLRETIQEPLQWTDENYGKIKTSYDSHREICMKKTPIKAQAKGQIEIDARYLQLMAERNQAKAMFLRSAKLAGVVARPQADTDADVVSRIDVEEKFAQLKLLMWQRQLKIAFWLLHLKAKISGNARLDIRDKVADFVKSFIRNPASVRDSYLNFAFLGPPGTGKTELAKSLGKVISSLGLLSTDNFFSLTAADFAGQYVGQTAIKTQKVLLEGLEGVTFLDEAYALTTDGDQYGKEAIAQIVATLDKRMGQMSMMVAGYEKEMKKDFFGVNVGMARRFPHQWVLKDYSGEDLMNIFKSFFDANRKDINTYLTSDAQEMVGKFMKEYHGHFTNQAGDVQQMYATAQQLTSNKGNILDVDDLEPLFTLVKDRLKPKQKGKGRAQKLRYVTNIDQILADFKKEKYDTEISYGDEIKVITNKKGSADQWSDQSEEWSDEGKGKKICILFDKEKTTHLYGEGGQNPDEGTGSKGTRRICVWYDADKLTHVLPDEPP